MVYNIGTIINKLFAKEKRQATKRRKSSLNGKSTRAKLYVLWRSHHSCLTEIENYGSTRESLGRAATHYKKKKMYRNIRLDEFPILWRLIFSHESWEPISCYKRWNSNKQSATRWINFYNTEHSLLCSCSSKILWKANKSRKELVSKICDVTLNNVHQRNFPWKTGWQE